jgi:uncharacterized protein (DUF1684 family)
MLRFYFNRFELPILIMNLKRNKKLLENLVMRKILVLLSIMALSCSEKKTITAEEREAHRTEIEKWHAKRLEDVKAPNGWLNLIGLYWLEPGINTFGSGADNALVFANTSLPPKAGHFLLHGDTVTLVAEKDVVIKSGSDTIRNEIIFNAANKTNRTLDYGPIRWSIIKRDDKVGVRVRDLASKAVTDFKGVERFPVDINWRLPARFEKGDSLRTIEVTNIIGQTVAQPSPGTIVFTVNDVEHRLDVMEGNEEFFIVFADATTGHDTYGGGRFINVKKPDTEGNTIIDFNKAYNPPCVFSPYATCPLPPPQNHLKLKVVAGEKTYLGEHHH